MRPSNAEQRRRWRRRRSRRRRRPRGAFAPLWPGGGQLKSIPIFRYSEQIRPPRIASHIRSHVRSRAFARLGAAGTARGGASRAALAGRSRSSLLGRRGPCVSPSRPQSHPPSSGSLLPSSRPHWPSCGLPPPRPAGRAVRGALVRMLSVCRAASPLVAGSILVRAARRPMLSAAPGSAFRVRSSLVAASVAPEGRPSLPPHPWPSPRCARPPCALPPGPTPRLLRVAQGRACRLRWRRAAPPSPPASPGKVMKKMEGGAHDGAGRSAFRR